uniref:C2H2-type domain-containing protein n=1 Tax=Ciona intestinalis TaxID=7719 RepID=H2XZX2_CIOIN
MAGPSSPAIKRSVKMFSTEEELVIGKFMVESWSKNYRIPQSLLFDCLKKHLEKYPRMTRAKDNRPSSFWQQRFFERNQSVVAAYKNFKTLPYKEFPVVSDVMLDELLQELSAVDKPPPPSVKSKSSEDFVYEGEVSPQKPRLVGPNAVVKKAKKAVESSSGSEDLAAKVRMKVLHKRSKTVEEGKKKSTKKVSINKSKDDSGVMDDVKIIAESSGVKKSTKEKKKDAPQDPPKAIEPETPSEPPAPVKYEVGENVQAKDCGKWYKAKIIEVDKDKGEVLVHFNGWGKRFDTIFPVGSELLRGLVQVVKKVEVKKFNVGDDVLSQWTDGKFYPGTVIGVKGSGSYVVMFFDGLKKLLRPNLLKPMSEKEKEEAMKEAQRAYLASIETKHTEPTSPQHEVGEGRRYRTSANDRERRSAARKESVEISSDRRNRKRKIQETPSTPNPPLPTTPPKVFHAKRARIDKISGSLLDKAVTTMETTTTTSVTTSTSLSKPPEMKGDPEWTTTASDDSDSPLVIDEEEVKAGRKARDHKNSKVEIEPKHKDGVEKVLNGGRTIMEVAEEMSIDPVELREALLHHNGVISGLSDPHLLTHSDEENVINWIHDMTDYGWPITDQHIAEQIKAILTQQRKLVLFTNMGTINFPSTTWIFPGRKKPLARFRFDREGFDEWLMRWICTLRVTDVVPNAVYYCDQTVFDATPKFMHDVTFTRGGVKLNVSAAKNKISILTCIGADGSVFEPFHLMPGDSDKLTGTMGFRKQGVVDSDVIFHWMREIFIKKIPHHRPVALLMDLSVEQINHNLLKFARDNKIILYRFLPAGACFLQHPDQKLFGRLRLQWKKTVISKFLKERTNQMIPVEKFQEVFKSECLKIFTPSNIKMCFELTKIYTPTSDEEVTTFIKKQESKEKRNKRKLSKPLLYVPPVETDQPKQTTIPDRPAGKPPTPQESEDKPQTDKPSKEKHCFMKGETVLAKWVDCRLYFAKILQCFAEDTYKIRYFDGHVKIVKEDFLRPYTGEVPQLPPTPSTHKKPRHQSEDNRPKSLPRKPSEKVRRASESSPGKLGREHEGPALVATDLGTRSKTNKISETVLYLAPVERVKYRAGEQVLCRWTDRKFYPATVIKQKDLDHYLIKYFDNRKKVVKHNWLSPWKPPVSTTNQAAPSTQTTNQATAAVSTTNQVKGKDKPTNQDAGELTPEKKKSEVNKDGASKQGDFPVLFTKGSSVLARWKDCRSYPGTILAVHDDGQYTVQYYDGMTNRVRKEMVKAWDSTAIPKEKRGRPKVKESVRPEVNISKGTIPTSVVTTTNDNEDESKTIKCKVPGCSKIFRNQGSLKQHQKHFHHKRYKLRDGSPPKRKASKDEKEVSVKRRVSADYHKSHEAMEVKSRGTTEPKNRGTTEPKSRGGKPVIEILRMQQDLLHDEETSVESWEKQKVDGRSGSDAKSSDDQKVAAVEVQ